jgi:hypothetical protein
MNEQGVLIQPAQGYGKYDDLIFTPLAMPPPPVIDPEKFVDWMVADDMKTGKFPKERYERLTGLKYPWLMRSVIGDMSVLEDAFPEVLQYAKLYPFKKLRAVIFLAQDGRQEVFPHVDSDGLTGMRFYLQNRNVEGLHFFKGRERYDYFDPYKPDANGNPIAVDFNRYFHMDDRVYAKFPPGSRSFMLNSARAVHAIDANTCKLGDRIAVLIQGELDREKLDALISASLSRYPEYALWY